MEGKPRCSHTQFTAHSCCCSRLRSCAWSLGRSVAAHCWSGHCRQCFLFLWKWKSSLNFLWLLKTGTKCGFFFFNTLLLFFLIIYLVAPGLRCGTGVLSGGMPAPSCDTWGPVPQPGPCIASMASQSLGYRGNSMWVFLKGEVLWQLWKSRAHFKGWKTAATGSSYWRPPLCQLCISPSREPWDSS